jgi:predicted alpha/beta superfamily hydrolase
MSSFSRFRIKKFEVPHWLEGQGQVHRHDSFPSVILGNHRTIEVYLPPGYDSEPERRYPVLYLHDGQNLFDSASAANGMAWEARTTADRLIQAGKLPPLIQVGIASTAERLEEFATVRDEKEQAGGRGLMYGRFVLEEVKPFIDRHYRTKPARIDTGVAGSSMGGLISLLMARHFSDRFALCGILSPSLWWSREAVFTELAGDIAWMKQMRFWVDMGTREGSNRGPVTAALKGTRRLIEVFDQGGLLPGHDYCYWEIAGGEHNEIHWSRRFDKVLLYLFGRPLLEKVNRRV